MSVQRYMGPSASLYLKATDVLVLLWLFEEDT